MADTIRGATEALVRAHRTGSQFDPKGTLENVAAAYAVQDAVAGTLWLSTGDRIRGWKVGSSDPKVTPIAAPMPASKVFESVAELPAANFHWIGIEAELAYRLSADLPPRATPYDDDAIAGAIESVHVAIEVCDSRIRDWKTADPHWKLADNQMNAALVVGAGRPDWRNVDPTRERCTLTVNGEVVGEATGAHPFGDPLKLLPWLANHCAKRRGGLRAGDVVTTGSWTGMSFVEPGADVVANFAGVGEARVWFPS